MRDRDDTGDGSRRRATRRRVLALGGAAGLTGLAGCSGLIGGNDGAGNGELSIGQFRGSGAFVEGRPAPGGTSIEDLPDLSGSLSIYLAGGEGGLYDRLVRLFEQHYAEFSANVEILETSQLVSRIRTEHESDAVQADMLVTVDAGSLGAVADMGATSPLSEDVLSPVSASFKSDDGHWVGFAGRARAVPYNTDVLSESDVPTTVHDFPDTPALADTVGWAPSYPAFQGFVTAMRINRSDDVARQWLQSMLDHGVTEYRDEWYVSNNVADGNVAAGFANHYYALRVQRDRPEAPIALAFTENDAGALVNVSGAEVFSSSGKQDLANDFIRHLLSAEAQEFFATRTFAYPMISGVDPVGDLPSIDQLNPPEIDLTRLADVGGTLDLMREVGVL